MDRNKWTTQAQMGEGGSEAGDMKSDPNKTASRDRRGNKRDDNVHNKREDEGVC